MSNLDILSRKANFVQMKSSDLNVNIASTSKNDEKNENNGCNCSDGATSCKMLDDNGKIRKNSLTSDTNDCKIDVSDPFELESIDPSFEYKGYHKFSRILGRGSFGTVIECERKKDNKLVALKLFKCKGIHKWIHESLVLNDLDDCMKIQSEFFSPSSLQESSDRLLPLEVACLARANKLNNIVKLVDYIPANNEQCRKISQAKNNSSTNEKENAIIGIVLERNPSEVSLFEYLAQNDRMSESEARLIMKQIIEASLTLLHSGILHGDLKSENILIEPITRQIKLIDFGSAQFLDSSIPMTSMTNANLNNNKYSFIKCKNQSLLTKPVRTFRGTNLYKPPEFILHHCFYPRPSTVWTFGIILFDMVCGHFPFDNDSDVLTHQDKDIIFTRADLTESFKDLVRRCLAFYVAERIVIEKVITHPWLNVI